MNIDSQNIDSEPVITPEIARRAQKIINRADRLRDSLANADAAARAEICKQLELSRKSLGLVVLELYDGDQDKALLSSAFELNFIEITAAIEPPKAPTIRGFPGARRIKTGYDGNSYPVDR